MVGGPVALRPLAADELDAATALCLRSKAHWGYDAGFMAACVPELTLTRQDLERDRIAVADGIGGLAGLVQLSCAGRDAVLEKLFVNPAAMRLGLGARLFLWAAATARLQSARNLTVVADPAAAGFYRRMGCTVAGSEPSGSIPGRRLPRLVLRLDTASGA